MHTCFWSFSCIHRGNKLAYSLHNLVHCNWSIHIVHIISYFWFPELSSIYHKIWLWAPMVHRPEIIHCNLINSNTKPPRAFIFDTLSLGVWYMWTVVTSRRRLCYVTVFERRIFVWVQGTPNRFYHKLTMYVFIKFLLVAKENGCMTL